MLAPRLHTFMYVCTRRDPTRPSRELRMRTATTAPIAVLLAACSHKAPPAGGMAMPPTPVSVVTATARDIPRDFEYLGLTEGSREVEVRARVMGYLESRHFTEGAMVSAGDLLFVIDPKPLQAQEVWAKAELAVAEAREQQTAREAKRLEPLVADEAVTRKEHDDAVSADLIAK